MPGLVTLRPLTSAGKTGRNAASTVSAPKPDKAWDERLPLPLQQQQQRAWPLQVSNHLRASQVHPLKARLLCGRRETAGNGHYLSSASEHEPSSVCLAAMVHEFMEQDVVSCGRPRCNCENAVSGCIHFSTSTESDDTKAAAGGELAEILQGLIPCASSAERKLLPLVTAAVSQFRQDAGELDSGFAACLRRLVMRKLRSDGYNAAICKSRWDHGGGFPGGDYEYLDVVVEGHRGKVERIVVDVDFREQFEIARATNHYKAMLNQLPEVFVGKPDRLQQIVSIMSDAAKRSLKKRGMHLPPWRKPEYMRAKWFSPYKRTTNEAALAHKGGQEDELVMDLDLSCIAMTDSRFTNQMEFPYGRPGKVALPEDLDERLFITGNGKRLEQQVPQRFVRGGGRMRLGGDDSITVFVTDWQPPTVKPRTSQKMEKTGLAAVLKEAGLTRALHRHQ